MAWTTPRDWATGELVTAAMMNAHVRDNLKALGPVVAGIVTGSTGAISSGTTATCSRTGAGAYTVTFSTAFAVTPSVELQPVSPYHAYLIGSPPVSTTGFGVSTGTANAQAAHDADFHFWAKAPS